MNRAFATLLFVTTALSAGGPPCLPPDLAFSLQPATLDLAPALLLNPAAFRARYQDLRARHPDFQPDHLACLAAHAAGEQPLAPIAEAWRETPDPALRSMVLMGVFRTTPEEPLKQLSTRYHENACRTPRPNAYDLQVAGDALASTSEANREKYLTSFLRLYGPGSAVHYKIEANDCIFLSARALAQAALATLPPPKRQLYEPKLRPFHE